LCAPAGTNPETQGKAHMLATEGIKYAYKSNALGRSHKLNIEVHVCTKINTEVYN